MKKIVIFDMDGTLINSSSDMTSSINYVRKTKYGLEPIPKEMVTKYINMQNVNLAKIFYGADEYSKEDSELFHRHYIDECIVNSHLYDGVYEMLEVLKSNEIKLSLATNASTVFARRMSSHLKIDQFMDYIVGADIVKNSKPAPDMLELILKRYAYDRNLSKAFMVGDSSKDIDAAKNADITPIFASWGYTSYENASYIIETPQQLLEIVLN